MADGDDTRIGGQGSPALGPVQRVRQVASRGRARAGADDEGRTGEAPQQHHHLDDPGIRAGPRGGLPDWLGRNLNIYV